MQCVAVVSISDLKLRVHLVFRVLPTYSHQPYYVNATNLCIKRTSLSSEKYLLIPSIAHYIRSEGRTKIGHTEATSTAKRPLPSTQYKTSTSLLLSRPLLDIERTICYISSKYPCSDHILEERSSDWVLFNACSLADSLSRTLACADLPLTRFQ